MGGPYCAVAPAPAYSVVGSVRDAEGARDAGRAAAGGLGEVAGERAAEAGRAGAGPAVPGAVHDAGAGAALGDEPAPADGHEPDGAGGAVEAAAGSRGEDDEAGRAGVRVRAADVVPGLRAGAGARCAGLSYCGAPRA